MLSVDVFFTIVGCAAAKNYMPLRDTQLTKWLDSKMGKSARIVRFYVSLTGARLNNLIPDNEMELKIMKWRHACGSSLLRLFGSHFP